MSSPFTQETIQMRHRFAAPVFAVLVLALAAFTGSALAGDGHGNGGGSGNSNSDKQTQSTQSSSTQSQSTKQDKQSSTSAPTPTTADNSTGVKPSSTTKPHDTHAAASSNKTKQYGNGQTAGQIATQAGHGNDVLHGPGNSQPHKTTACPGGHEVDVHALKNKDGKCGSSSQTSSPASKSHESKKVEVKKTEKVEVTKTEKTHVEKTKKSDVEVKKTDEQKTKSSDVASSAHAHVTICHATGSSSNPYVMISPSASGVFHGHLGHQDGRDIVPPFTWKGTTYSENWTDLGQKLYNAGCTAPATTQTEVQGVQTSQPCGATTQTVTEQVLVGVKHKTGNGKFVLIHPSKSSAHYTGKHKDDVEVYETVTKTVTVPATNCPATSPAQNEAPTTTTTTTTTTSSSTLAPTPPASGGVAAANTSATAPATASAPAAATPTAAPAAGGVKGAVVALKPTKTKPAGGVLGATTRLGGTIASTQLPFTGLPLWIFALVAAGLIGAGVAMRRASSNRI
jgi:hypothetical protein